MKKQIKFRASSVGKLMTGQVGLTDKQKEQLDSLIKRREESKTGQQKPLSGNMIKTIEELESKKDHCELGQTAKTMIDEMFLRIEFGYKEIVSTKEMKKGHLCEAESRDLVQKVLGGGFRKRNTTNFHSELFTGTPDIILNIEQEGQTDKIVEDIKNSWNLRTFFNADGSDKSYYWQGQTYMHLTGADFFRLIYTLNPLPEELFADEERKLYYQYGQDSENLDYLEALEQLQHNNSLILDLEPEQRVKVFTFERDEKAIEDMKKQAEAGIEYYNTLKL